MYSEFCVECTSKIFIPNLSEYGFVSGKSGFFKMASNTDNCNGSLH